ncbi:MAG: DUF1499 domain-containing protein [Gammaproteobacteria bacterium]
MARPTSTPRRLILLWTLLALIAGLVAVIMVAIAGPLYAHDSIRLGTAFGLLRHGAWVGIAAAAAAILALIATLVARRLGAVVIAAIALALGLGAFIWPWTMLRTAQAAPPIHDVATNPSHPPQFTALAKIRKTTPNGLEYGGGGPKMAQAEQAQIAHFLQSAAGQSNPQHTQVAAACTSWGRNCLMVLQRAYYPGVQSLAAPGIAPARTYAAALATVKAMDWKIAAADAASGHIEATATTGWFRFKDDVVIEVASDGAGGGSIVNMRSESRLGLSDLGKNAQRVKAYMNRLGKRLSASGK